MAVQTLSIHLSGARKKSRKEPKKAIQLVVELVELSDVLQEIGVVLQRGYQRVRDVVVPPLCLSCDAIVDEAGGCCPACWQKIRFISPPFCGVTGKPFSHDLGEGMLSAEAIADPPPYEKCRSAVFYDGQTRRFVTNLKFGDRTNLAPWMAKWMVRAGRELLKPEQFIIPVPLHPMRLLQRRYNQSAELGRIIARDTGQPFRPDLLSRIRKTRQQVGLSSNERQRNVQGSLRPEAGIVRKRSFTH